MRSSKTAKVLLLLIPVLLGAFLLLHATSRYGVGVSRDSVSYLNAAHNLAFSGILATDILPGSPRPLTIWPALYPALLSTLHFTGAQLLQSTRLLNALLFAAYVILMQLVVLRATRGAIYVTFAAGLFVALSYSTLHIYARVWSETLFLTLLLGGMLFLGHYLQRPGWPTLIVSGLLFALAWLTRYIGVTLLVTGNIAILVMCERRFRRKALDAMTFSATMLVPMSLLLARNWLVADSTVSRLVKIQSVGSTWWGQGFDAISAWLIPADSPTSFQTAAIAIVLISVVTSAVLVLQDRLLNQEVMTNKRREWVYPATMLLFITVYISVFFTVVTVSDPPVPIDTRTLSPVFSALVVIFAYAAHRFLERTPNHRRALSVVAALIVGLMITFQLLRSVRWSLAAHDAGLHYNTAAYQESPVIEAARRLSDNATIYSNNPPLIFFLADQKVGSLGGRACDISCTDLKTEFQEMKQTSTDDIALLWVPVFDKALCEPCLKRLAPEYGFDLIEKDDHFQLWQSSSAE